MEKTKYVVYFSIDSVISQLAINKLIARFVGCVGCGSIPNFKVFLAQHDSAVKKGGNIYLAYSPR